MLMDLHAMILQVPFRNYTVIPVTPRCNTKNKRNLKKGLIFCVNSEDILRSERKYDGATTRFKQHSLPSPECEPIIKIT